MTSCREELGNTGSVETGLSQTKSRTQTSTTSTNNDSIVLVILERDSSQNSFNHFLPAAHTVPFPVPPQGPSFTYNNRILLSNGTLSLCSAQGLVGKYPGCRREKTNQSVYTVILRREVYSMGGWVSWTYQPAGRKKKDVSDSAEHERSVTQSTSAQFSIPAMR